MSHKIQLLAGAAGIIAAALLIQAVPVQAGTCEPVTVQGRAKDPAAATTQAHIKLTQEAIRIGGKVKQNSTDCKPANQGFVCTISAVVCP